MNDLLIQLVSQLDDGIVMFDIHGKVLYSNLVNTRFSDIVIDDEIADDDVLREVSDIKINKNSSVKKIKLNKFEQVKNNNHSVLIFSENIFCLYIRDELDKAKFITLRENMFALINHELRTPMQGLIGGAQLLSSMLKDCDGEVREPEKFNAFVNMVMESVEKVTSKMERLLELSEAYGDDPIYNNERIQLYDVVKKAIDGLRYLSLYKNITIEIVQKGEEIGALYGSFGWLKRAIEECLRNSIEHSSEGSKIYIEFEQRSDFALIIIRDFGGGIASNVKQTLFEPFTGGGDKDQYSNQGLGIGLALAINIIEKHGGTIKDVSINGGVEFHIELPTGAGQNSNKEIDVQQAQLYAKDLAKLMSTLHENSIDNGRHE